MKPFIAIGAALAAGAAYVLGKPKKANAAASFETEVTPEGAAIAKGEVTVPSGTLVPGYGIDGKPVTIPKGAVSILSPGLPPLPTIGTGPTSGATSVTPTGVVDDAFDVLVANAIAKGDLALLEDLAKQALARGLTDVAESIRAEIARIKGSAPAPTPVKAPTTAPVSTYLGRATISMKAGSRGPDVTEWQRLIGVKQDGIFGPITDSATRTWQKVHVDSTGKPLVVDGIVGPRTWAAAYAVKPALATAPRTTAPPPVTVPKVTTTAPAPTTSLYPTIRKGSTGAAVKKWQGIVGVKVDGIFGPITDTATRAFQKTKGLVVDGVVGPKTWAAGLASDVLVSLNAPAPTVTPTVTNSVESPMRQAAREMTDYLFSIGCLAGRGREDKTRIKGWQSKLGLVVDGSYGRNSAKAVMLQGFVPCVPFYWPSTGTQTAKNEFTAFVRQYADNDVGRKAQWDKLLADIPRS